MVWAVPSRWWRSRWWRSSASTPAHWRSPASRPRNGRPPLCSASRPGSRRSLLATSIDDRGVPWAVVRDGEHSASRRKWPAHPPSICRDQLIVGVTLREPHPYPIYGERGGVRAPLDDQSRLQSKSTAPMEGPSVASFSYTAGASSGDATSETRPSIRSLPERRESKRTR